jgi:hypothetical protein
MAYASGCNQISVVCQGNQITKVNPVIDCFSEQNKLVLKWASRKIEKTISVVPQL